MKKALFVVADRVGTATVVFLDRWAWAEQYLMVSAFMAVVMGVAMTISFMLIPVLPGIGAWYSSFSILTIIAVYAIVMIRAVVGGIVFRTVTLKRGAEPTGIWIIFYETMVLFLIPIGIILARIFPKK